MSVKEAQCEAREATSWVLGSYTFFPSFIHLSQQIATELCMRLGANRSSKTKVQFPDGTFLLIFQLFTFYVYLRGGFSLGPALSFFLYLGWKEYLYLFPWRRLVRPRNTSGGLYHFFIGRIEPLTHSMICIYILFCWALLSIVVSLYWKKSFNHNNFKVSKHKNHPTPLLSHFSGFTVKC